MRVDHLWLVRRHRVPPDTKAQKTALGTERYLTWTCVETIRSRRSPPATAAGYRVVGVELADGRCRCTRLDLGATSASPSATRTGPLARVLGACDDVAFIPQLGRVGSLNVADRGRHRHLRGPAAALVGLSPTNASDQVRLR